ncbi:MAG: hypothetical protein AB7I37_13830 [Pirellulales bacterium]
MLIIASSAYCTPELQSEFGQLPPAFLPFGNRRLYEHQLALAGEAYDEVYLSLPWTFVPTDFDLARLRSLNVEIVRVPVGLTTGEAIWFLLEQLGTDRRVDILYGDTLIRDIDFERTNIYAVATPTDNYPWGYCPGASDRPPSNQPRVIAGYFSFARGADLATALDAAGNDFLAAVHQYHDDVGPLQPAIVEEWHDFGHLTTYYRSRTQVTTERCFNRLQISRAGVTKAGSNADKLRAEAHWFQQIPPALRRFTPQFLGEDTSADAYSYSLEYLHLPPLNDLFVFGDLPPFVWQGIFSACDEFLTAAAAHVRQPLVDVQQRYLDHTLHRLGTYARQAGTSLSREWTINGRAVPSLERVVRDCYDEVLSRDMRQPLAIVHGDYCFSNILYDFRARQVKVIDPRGLGVDGAPSILGDVRYDIGKLTHSVMGLYDFIVADRFRLAESGAAFDLELPFQEVRPIQQLFGRCRFLGRRPAEWSGHAVATLLFLAMLPLHADSPKRQRALLANALRLYVEREQSHDRDSDGGTELQIHPGGLPVAQIHARSA